MFRWITSFKKATFSTQAFIVINFVFMLSILLTGLYCYARLDYVRSYKSNTSAAEKPPNT